MMTQDTLTPSTDADEACDVSLKTLGVEAIGHRLGAAPPLSLVT
jgi:hypothetical protein